MTTHQQRISLKRLKVADFASEETLCFTATVVFDGKAMAEARNDGHGGMTFLRPLEGQRDRLAEAEAFAKTLPPEVTEYDDPKDSAKRLTIEITLDYLVDHLANTMHADKKIRAAFNRDISNKVLFVKDGKLKYIKGTKLKAISDRRAYFDKLRAHHGPSIEVLAELPLEAAFVLWKHHMIDDDTP